MVKKVLILGSNSFSGGVLVNELLKSEFEVTAVSRSSEIARCYRPYPTDLSNFKFLSLGSNFEPKKVVKICDSQKIDTVINFVAQSMVAQSWNTPQDWYSTNCVWLSELANSLNSWGGLKRFVQFTTPEVYGSMNNWLSEGQAFKPSTPYAISRAAGDWHLEALYKNFNFPVIFTRTANIYGPFQPRFRLIPKFILSVLQNTTFKLHGGGHSKRSFIFSEDVARALHKVILNGKLGETYHISTKTALPISEVVRGIASLMGVRSEDFIDEADELRGKDEAYLLDSSKIRTELDWSDEIDIETGLSKTIGWAKENFDEILRQPEAYQHRR